METAPQHRSKPIAFIDFASVLSAVAVVYLHTNGAFWRWRPDAVQPWWPSANFIESFFIFAVPVFFMISGATLMDFNERYGLGTYFKKRAQKTLVPYVVWSLVGLAFQLVVTHEIAPDAVTLGFITRGLLNGSLGPGDVYWFFIALFCLYLSIPLFAEVPKERRTHIFAYLAVATFVLNILAPFVVALTGRNIPVTVTVGVGAGYLFYLFTGWIICHCEIPRPWRIAIYLLAVAGLVAQVVGTQVLTPRLGEIAMTFKGYQNLPCVLQSVGAFLFFKQVGGALMRQETVARVIGFLKHYTFAVYLLHIFILQMVVMLLRIDVTSLAWRLFAPLGIVALVVAFTWLVRKIPGVRRWLLP